MSTKSDMLSAVREGNNILLNIGFDSFIFCQLYNESIHNIIKVPLEVYSLKWGGGGMCPMMCLHDIPTQTPFSHNDTIKHRFIGIVYSLPDM